MNLAHTGDGCEKTRRYLDSYISNELLIETNHEVLRHLDLCRECSAELDERTRVRSQLKAAVKAQPAPPELAALVRERIRREESPSGWRGQWQMALAAAAAVVVCAGIWIGQRPGVLPPLGSRPAQDAFIQKISAKLSVLRVGLADHVHCSVFRRYPANAPTAEEMARELGPEYQGLLPVFAAAAPKDYRVVMAHRCGYKGRHFVHLTMQKGTSLVSLVIARKEGDESMRDLAAALHAGEIPIYRTAAERFEVAGFDAGEFMAFVVSDMGRKANLQVASALASPVRDMLRKVNG
jgi:anti-sigma factor RsiW